MDENGVPFDRELTKNQKERLVEFKAFKKELEQEDPFLESAEVLGLFLEYEDERNVPLLGHEVETSSSSSSSSSSGSADTTCTSTTTVIESSSNNSGSDGTGDRDENTSSTDDDNESDEEEDKREDYPHQNDNNNNNENEQRGDSYFDPETFVKDVSECLHVNDSIDDETEYKDGNSKGTSSGVSSLDVSHEQLRSDTTRHDRIRYDTIPYTTFFNTIIHLERYPTLILQLSFSLYGYSTYLYVFSLPILVVGIAFFPVVFKLIVEEVYDNRCWRRRSKRMWWISFAFIFFLFLFLAVVVRR